MNISGFVLPVSIMVFAFMTSGIAAEIHFDAKGKSPSKNTIAKWEDVKDKMGFEDKRDFEEQQKGFIVAPEYTEIMAAAGHIAWSMGEYAFLLEDKEYKSIHPSLQRQASAESDLIAIQRALLDQRVNLYLALGGEW